MIGRLSEIRRNGHPVADNAVVYRLRQRAGIGLADDGRFEQFEIGLHAGAKALNDQKFSIYLLDSRRIRCRLFRNGSSLPARRKNQVSAAESGPGAQPELDSGSQPDVSRADCRSAGSARVQEPGMTTDKTAGRAR